MSKQQDIPRLTEHADIPRLTDKLVAEPAPDPVTETRTSSPRDDLKAALEIEASFIIDELLDELMPRLEIRLKERLLERSQHILKSINNA